MDKYKKLMGNTLIFAIGQFGAKLLSFFLVKLYTATLTNAEYSTADLLYNTLNVLVPVVTFSMSDAIIRFGLDKAYDKRKVYTTANIMTLLGMAIFALTTPIWNSTSVYHGYTMLLYAYCYFSCFRSMASQQVRAKGLVRLFAIDGILTTLTQFLCNLIFMLWLDMGINGYILSFIVSDFLSLCFLMFMARLDKSFDTKFIDVRLIKEMLRYSAPLIPTYLLWWITSYSDRLFVINMVGSETNGIYSVAHKIPTLVMFVTTMFYQAWQMSSIEEKDSRTLGKFYKTVFGAYSSLMFIAAAGLILIAKPLTYILIGNDSYKGAELYSTILIVSMVFQCFCQFLASIYSVKKKSKNSCLTAFSAAAANIILNAILVPKLGAYGAAIATAISYFVCFAIRICDARRYIFFKVDFFRAAINIIVLITMCVLSIRQPSLYVMWLILCFIFVALINFGAVVNTVQKIFGRKKQPAAGK
ncbi:MAG: lipopolysaccharide biosynthesis protein [Oscillospiraceae bacterium]